MGDPKTPAALRNASDQFFEWVKADREEEPASKPETLAKPADPSKPLPKRRPRFIIDAVTLLAADTSEGKVTLSGLGQYLKRTDPAFSPNLYGHSGLLDMVRTYDLLLLKNEPGGRWSVSLAPVEGATP